MVLCPSNCIITHHISRCIINQLISSVRRMSRLSFYCLVFLLVAMEKWD